MLDAYILHILIIIGIFSILAMGLNLAMGYTGLVNFGYAAFYAIGAYTSALLTIYLDVPWIFALIIGGLFAAAAGYLLCFPSLRLKGDYLALATLGFGFIIEAILRNWISLTNGPMGISKIPKANLFGLEFSSLFSYFIVIVIFGLIVYFILRKIIHSPFGRVLRSIRDDELASSMLGKNTFKYKSWALIISGFIGGIAGSLYAHYLTYIDPSTFGIMESIFIVMAIIVGGIGSLEGSIIGAVLIYLLPEPLRLLSLPASAIGALRQMIYAAILIVLIMKKPQGILGNLKRRVSGGRRND